MNEVQRLKKEWEAAIDIYLHIDNAAWSDMAAVAIKAAYDKWQEELNKITSDTKQTIIRNVSYEII